MRDYSRFDEYLNILEEDVYEQPMDDGHSAMAQHVINSWIKDLEDCKTVLDAGCGQGDAQEWFENIGMEYTGITLGSDAEIAIRSHRNVSKQDFSFLPYPDASFDLIFARHSLEHSPFPLLTLMEWHRVGKKWLCVVLPQPGYWKWGGKNHYSVMSIGQARFLLRRAGWEIKKYDKTDIREYRIFCERMKKGTDTPEAEDNDLFVDHPMKQLKKFMEKEVSEYIDMRKAYTERYKIFNFAEIAILTIKQLKKKARGE
jgi:ubiquinone/menaquinone biosynthesis C-methylase UbiE